MCIWPHVKGVQYTASDKHRTNSVVPPTKEASLACLPALHSSLTDCRAYPVYIISFWLYMCIAIHKRIEKDIQAREACLVKDTTKLVLHPSGVVWSIPLIMCIFGQIYMGQTGRCLNMCLGEHQHRCDIVDVGMT